MPGPSTARLIVIYCRYSTDMQREQSCEDQERECRRHLQRMGIDHTNAVAIHDSAISGLKEDREGFTRIMAMIEAMQIAILVVDEQSRLSRGHFVSAIIADLIFGEGRFISVNEGIDTDREGWQELVGFSAVRHSMSSTDTARRIRRGQIGRLHSKNGVAGSFPYGLRSRYAEGDYVEQLKNGRRPLKEAYICEQEAEVVRWVFQSVLNGMSYGQIARSLNERQVPKGQNENVPTWGTASIAFMLRNRTYIGEWTYGKSKRVRDSRGRIRYVRREPGEYEVVNRPHLRIVDEETWSAVQKLLQGRANGRGAYGKGSCHPKQEFPKTNLGGLIRCMGCGRRMLLAGSKNHRTFRCGNVQSGICNMHRHVSVKKIEEALFSYLATAICAHEDWVNAVVEAVAEAITTSQGNLPKQIAEDQLMYDGLIKKIEHWLEQVEDGRIAIASVQKRIQKLEVDAANLKDRIKVNQHKLKTEIILPDTQEVKEYLGSLTEMLAESKPELAGLLKKIIVKADLYEVPSNFSQQGEIGLRVKLNPDELARMAIGPSLVHTNIDMSTVRKEKFSNSEVDLVVCPMGLADRWWSRINELMNRGQSYTQIADELDLSVTAVSGIIHRVRKVVGYELKKSKAPDWAVVGPQIHKQRMEGTSWQQIATNLELPMSQMRLAHAAWCEETGTAIFGPKPLWEILGPEAHAMIKNGKCYPVIAAELGVEPAVVRSAYENWCRKTGNKMVRFRSVRFKGDDWARVEAMRAAGKSWAEIGHVFGRDGTYIGVSYRNRRRRLRRKSAAS